MEKKKTPIITHTEILARAIQSIKQEIDGWRENCENMQEGAQMFEAATAGLSAKLDALKDLYRIETGNDY